MKLKIKESDNLKFLVLVLVATLLFTMYTSVSAIILVSVAVVVSVLGYRALDMAFRYVQVFGNVEYIDPITLYFEIGESGYLGEHGETEECYVLQAHVKNKDKVTYCKAMYLSKDDFDILKHSNSIKFGKNVLYRLGFLELHAETTISETISRHIIKEYKELL